MVVGLLATTCPKPEHESDEFEFCCGKKRQDGSIITGRKFKDICSRIATLLAIYLNNLTVWQNSRWSFVWFFLLENNLSEVILQKQTFTVISWQYLLNETKREAYSVQIIYLMKKKFKWTSCPYDFRKIIRPWLLIMGLPMEYFLPCYSTMYHL